MTGWDPFVAWRRKHSEAVAREVLADAGLGGRGQDDSEADQGTEGAAASVDMNDLIRQAARRRAGGTAAR
ncbi:MAG: hypothetical protein M3460_13350 [Actinomycetota bacterium]|nr:hypothetical protein [Actinomycetota bacterium]